MTPLDTMEAHNLAHAFLGYFAIFVLLLLASACAAVLIVRGASSIRENSK